MHRWLMIMLAGSLSVAAAGCAGRKSSLLLERHARGPLQQTPEVGRRAEWKLDPIM